jgi:hypothetical protein
MRVAIFFSNALIAFTLFSKMLSAAGETSGDNPREKKKDTAAWTILVYMAADNSLAPYASYNIKDMSAGLASLNGVNVLVQWDKPRDNKTWRYQITPGSKVDAGSLNSEMGYDPSNELVKSMQWVVNSYPANNYALILWDHGSGIEDFYPGSTRGDTWLKLRPQLLGRGILYDDSQKTCLTNQGLTSALEQIKQLIGKNLDLIGMDACLMAMVEVSYQMKGLVNTFVGSEQTIPGYGFPYSYFIKPLSLNPAKTNPLQLATTILSSYKSFYTTQMPTPDFTLSTIDVTSIDLIKQNIDQFVSAVTACSKIDVATTKKIIVTARKASLSFEMPEYIDLYSFYANILNQTKKTTPKSSFILEKQNKKTRPKPTKEYQGALTKLNAILQDGLNKITTVVVQRVAGAVYAGSKGIAIYYPTSGPLDPTYLKTIFAQNTNWCAFIKSYR